MENWIHSIFWKKNWKLPLLVPTVALPHSSLRGWGHYSEGQRSVLGVAIFVVVILAPYWISFNFAKWQLWNTIRKCFTCGSGSRFPKKGAAAAACAADDVFITVVPLSCCCCCKLLFCRCFDAWLGVSRGCCWTSRAAVEAWGRLFDTAERLVDVRFCGWFCCCCCSKACSLSNLMN